MNEFGCILDVTWAVVPRWLWFTVLFLMGLSHSDNEKIYETLVREVWNLLKQRTWLWGRGFVLLNIVTCIVSYVTLTTFYCHLLITTIKTTICRQGKNVDTINDRCKQFRTSVFVFTWCVCGFVCVCGCVTEWSSTGPCSPLGVCLSGEVTLHLLIPPD